MFAPDMSGSEIQIVAGVLAVVVLAVLIQRRRSKAASDKRPGRR
jgi:hypothetical protein